MKTQWKAAATFAALVGAVLVVEGVWGLFSNEVFGIMTINRTRALIHLGLGLGAIVAAWRGRPLGYLTTLGGLLLAVAIVWSLPATQPFMTDLLAINQASAIAGFALAVLCFIFGSASGTRVDSPELERRGARRGGRASAAH